MPEEPTTATSDWETIGALSRPFPYRGWEDFPVTVPVKRPEDDPDTPRSYLLAALAVAVLAFAVYKCPLRKRDC